MSYWRYITASFLLVLSQGCSEPQRDPGDLANGFFEHLENREFNKAKTMATKVGRLEIEQLEKDLEAFDFSLPDSFFVFQFPTAATGDTVHVPFAIDSATLQHPYRLPLVRSAANHWHVHYERHDAVGVARYFLTAFHSGNFARAKEFISERSLGDLEFLEGIYGGWQGPEVTITGVGFNNDDGRALVMFREEGQPAEKKLTLVRQNGHWKVALGKSSELS